MCARTRYAISCVQTCVRVVQTSSVIATSERTCVPLENTRDRAYEYHMSRRIYRLGRFYKIKQTRERFVKKLIFSKPYTALLYTYLCTRLRDDKIMFRKIV